MQHVALGPQNWLLNAARKERRLVQVCLVSGVRLVGTVKSFDHLVVLLKTTGGMHTIEKRSITSVQWDDPGLLANKSSGSNPKVPVVIVRKRRLIRE
ncbi:RNA chaperone Hfq [Cupriavidus basilensis]|uniref:RNA chaperone Hfq n=1 Tax=Cupriavidus basilensis TaxID=68895 RepID=UPI003D3541C6